MHRNGRFRFVHSHAHIMRTKKNCNGDRNEGKNVYEPIVELAGQVGPVSVTGGGGVTMPSEITSWKQ